MDETVFSYKRFCLILRYKCGSIYLPKRLNPQGGRQTGIPEYQLLRRLVETKR